MWVSVVLLYLAWVYMGGEGVSVGWVELSESGMCVGDVSICSLGTAAVRYSGCFVFWEAVVCSMECQGVGGVCESASEMALCPFYLGEAGGISKSKSTVLGPACVHR